MTTLRSILIFLVIALSSFDSRAHTIDVTKGQLTEEGGKLRIEIKANLWSILLGKPVTDLTAEDYAQVPAAEQEATLKDSLTKSLSFAGDDGATLPSTVSLQRENTDSVSHETPVVYTIEASRAKVRTAKDFGTLILVTPTGQTLIAPDSESELLPLAGSKLEIFNQYVVLGFEHILPKGLDHVLFVLSLFLLAPALRPLLMQVSAFTLAHTISLALASLKIVEVSPSIVEPLIAFSIFYTAVENVFVRELKRWRVGLVFAFGLLHGLGFAGVLSELGLPREAFVESLLGFNIGVEFGQLAVIALAAFAVGWFRKKSWYRKGVVIPGSVAIALMGLYWTIERVFSN